MCRFVTNSLFLLLVLTCSSGWGQDGWPEAMIAFREKALASDKPTNIESTWYTTGGLQATKFDDALFPEQGVDLNAVDAKGKKLWSAAPQYLNGVVNDMNAGGNCATYLYRTITPAGPEKWPISLGSDDALMVWHNGKKLLSNPAARGPAPDQDKLELNLVTGKNELLLKIYNYSGGHGFYYQSKVTESNHKSLEQQFPLNMIRFNKYFPGNRQWFGDNSKTDLEREAVKGQLAKIKQSEELDARLAKLVADNAPPTSPEWLRLFEDAVLMVEGFERQKKEFASVNHEALKLALNDLAKTYPDQFKDVADLSKKVDDLIAALPAVTAAIEQGDKEVIGKHMEQYTKLQRDILLRNPILDFDRILMVKRKWSRSNKSDDYFSNLGLPQNWQGNSSTGRNHDNEIASLRYKDSSAELETVYKPAKNYFVGDVDLHFGAKKMMFSSIGTNDRWQIFEINVDGTGLRQVTIGAEEDIDNYDPMYLPDGRVIFDSTSGFHGVPCVGGGDYVANLHIMNADGTGVRRLCFDQDNDWCPTMLPNGRVLYLRWEYTDLAHYFSRILMHMNPDGTNQSEFYGSNSYWPNSLFYARPIPGHSSMFVGIVGGHHGVPRMGEMVLFDTARGRQEATGAIQRIPGYGKPVDAPIQDSLVQHSWPKFLHPYPLGNPSVPESTAKYFLVSAKLAPGAEWGIYLVDIFDNILLLKETPGYVLFEPVPLKETPVPPVIPDRVDPEKKTATVYLQNIYNGGGLRGVDKGTVKSLRIVQYEYAYRNMGGHFVIGMEGPWDVHWIVGTVPVFEDGSAIFEIPANTPVAIQPLDAEGKAMQQMRSWFVGMPGEFVSCVGCHERQNTTASAMPAIASRHKPVPPKPWYGPKRGFSFLREVQPVLDKYCVGCHSGKEGRPELADITPINIGSQSPLPRSYVDLHPYVRRNGPEGDDHLLTPLEFHVNTSTLFQMLRKGHHNVKLDEESWSKLITWVDSNVPCYGTWHETRGSVPKDFEQRRYDLKKMYAGVDENIEAIPDQPAERPAYIKPEPMPAKPAAVKIDGWPFATEAAVQKQKELGEISMSLDLGDGVVMNLMRVPAGEFVMGDLNGETDEYPTVRVKIEKPFWMASTEVSLAQYQLFDPEHMNGFYDAHGKDQSRPGFTQDGNPKCPVIRVSWKKAMAYCEWLSKKTGKRVTLPTEAQWEWACRAGTDTPFYYGDINADFSTYANLADKSISGLSLKRDDKYFDYELKDDRYNDGKLHLSDVDRYTANAWGLQNMIGNVAEWTRSVYKPYPYAAVEKTKSLDSDIMVVRGGSWYDRPKQARVSYRLDYPAWQSVYNVGFRVIVED